MNGLFAKNLVLSQNLLMRFISYQIELSKLMYLGITLKNTTSWSEAVYVYTTLEKDKSI